MGPAGGGKCLRERCVLKNAQVKMLESKGPLGHTSPGLRLVKARTSLELHKVQKGQPQFPSSLKLQV